MIWNRLPKEILIGSEVLKLGVYDAVVHSNIGSQAALNVLGIDLWTFCLAELDQQDHEHVHKAEFKAQEESKKKRKISRARKKKNGDKFSQKEGVTYVVGGFYFTKDSKV